MVILYIYIFLIIEMKHTVCSLLHYGVYGYLNPRMFLQCKEDSRLLFPQALVSTSLGF